MLLVVVIFWLSCFVLVFGFGLLLFFVTCFCWFGVGFLFVAWVCVMLRVLFVLLVWFWLLCPVDLVLCL